MATSVVCGLTEPLAAGLVAAGRQAQWEKQRKFRTIWDAVDWLKKTTRRLISTRRTSHGGEEVKR